MALSDGLEFVERGGDAEGVHGEDGARARRDCGFDLRRVEIERRRIDVHEYRSDSFVEQCVCGGDESERGENDFVAFFEAEGADGEVKTGSAGRNGDGAFRVSVLRDGGFEGFKLRAKAEAAAAENLCDGVDFRVGDVRSRKRDFHFCGTARLRRSEAPSGTPARTSAIFSDAVPSP